MRGNALAKILRKIADAVEKLDEAELEKFAASLSNKVHLSKSPSHKRPLPKNRHSKVDPFELEKTLAQLDDLPTRSAGMQLLNSLDLTRKELEVLARKRDVHFTKADDVTRMKEKIIEVTIGSRLNSRAIRGFE